VPAGFASSVAEGFGKDHALHCSILLERGPSRPVLLLLDLPEQLPALSGISERKNELEELRALRVAEATRTFDDALRLTFEGRSLEIRNRGRANSPSDTTFYLRGERILFTGDIVVQSPLPFVGASYPYDWVRVLQQIESMPVRMLVPGHGPVMTDLVYVGQVRSLIEAAVSRVQGFLSEGRPLEQAKKEIHFDDIRSQVPIWSDPGIDPVDWEQTRTALIERAWKNVRGQEN
jgi:glyoxylase-like metal-dependent hydrolase (beta-lactamase superfamily II)